MLRRATVTALVLGLAALAVPAGASARGDIRVNESIAGLHPGMTLDQVRKRLGRPSSQGAVSDVRVLTYEARGLSVSTYAGTKLVYTIQTTNRRHRTGSGLGVGSTRGALKRAFGRRLECDDFGVCRVGAFPGERTSFAILDGRVVSVSLLGRERSR